MNIPIELTPEEQAQHRAGTLAQIRREATQTEVETLNSMLIIAPEAVSLNGLTYTVHYAPYPCPCGAPGDVLFPYCQTCGGIGHDVDADDCHDCDGTGFMDDNHHLTRVGPARVERDGEKWMWVVGVER